MLNLSLMKWEKLVVLCSTGLIFATATSFATTPEGSNPVLAIHGGAGTILKTNMSPEREAEYREVLTQALKRGYKDLAQGGASLDAVEAAIRILEDSPLFNAGKGAVFTAEERNELDASIMDGATLEAGAVAGVTTVRNPISAARAVMERSVHVMLSGAGADSFAQSVGLITVDPSYYFTERRWKALQERKQEEALRTDTSNGRLPKKGSTSAGSYLGTVGAVALDRFGHLAAGTSTGGMTYKRFGRIGDSPVIGAGTYANRQCAVSATGHGEYFIRFVVAHDICARVAYQGVNIDEAARAVIYEVLENAGGMGGVIALDDRGTVSMPFNTAGMYRGVIRGDGSVRIEIYK